MSKIRNVAQLSGALVTLFLASCATQKPALTTTKDGKVINPYPAGSYDHFKADPSYPKTYNVWKNQELLAHTNPSNSSIRVNLGLQRAYLMNGKEVAMDYPICSGIPSRPTSAGTFHILEKVVDKKSNKYGKMIDANGEVVNRNADLGIDPVPEGGHFEGAPMPYWMRLTSDGVGHHIGPVKRHPASHACVRGPSATIPIVFSKVKVGTTVVIE
jgi:hypothetical protein